MLKNMQKAFILFVFLSFFVIGALAEDYIVNVESLKAIEETDSFEVQISKKEVLQEATAVALGGNDAILLTIGNDSDNILRDVTIYLIAYTENFEQVNVGGIESIMRIEHTPQMFSATNVDIHEHEQKTLSLQCDADTFTGVRAIIASYTTDAGTTIDNVVAENWYDEALSNSDRQMVVFD